MNSLLALLWWRKAAPEDLLSSQLFNERSFYPAFLNDLRGCRKEVIIESPFMTGRRIALFLPILRRLRRRGVRVVINTRHPQEHEGRLRLEAEGVLTTLFDIGAEVFFTGGHHRKLAILDGRVLWEGSLNILSQNESCEVMRRIASPQLVDQMMRFIRIEAL